MKKLNILHPDFFAVFKHLENPNQSQERHLKESYKIALEELLWGISKAYYPVILKALSEEEKNSFSSAILYGKEGYSRYSINRKGEIFLDFGSTNNEGIKERYRLAKKAYNGWENYSTWNVALYIQNEHDLYEAAKDSFKLQKEVGLTEWTCPYGFFLLQKDLKGKKTFDNVPWSCPTINEKEVGDMIREL